MQPVRRLEEQAAIRGDRPRAALAGVRGPRPRRLPGGCPARPAAAGWGRRARRASERNRPRSTPSRGTAGRPRPRTGRRPLRPCRREPTTNWCRRRPGTRRSPSPPLPSRSTRPIRRPRGAMRPPLRLRAGRSGRSLPPRGRRSPRLRGSWRSRDATGRRRRLAGPARRAQAPCGLRCTSCPCQAAPGSVARCRRARRRAGGRRRAGSRWDGRVARPRAGASHAAGGAGPDRGRHDTGRIRSARD